MTPRQARVALGGFFLLAVGVTSNALYLQGAVSGTAEKTASTARPEPRHPAPRTLKTVKAPERVPDRTPDKSLDTVAEAEAPLPESPTKSPPKTPQSIKVRMVRVATVGERAEEADTDTVRAVQEELKRQGYGPIETDGVLRLSTRAAIMAFEHDHSLGLTGEASQSLLKQLVFGTPETEPADEAEVRSPHAEALIKQVQQSLATRGYHVGSVDGQLSPDTVAALRTFETDQGLVPKGRISAEILERLQNGISMGGKHPQ